jgi:short-subunit dehydrogenase
MTTEPLAVVTGASSGIGEVFARRLSGRGYGLLLVARRRERLEELAAELGHAEPLAADLTCETGLEEVAERIAAQPNLEFLVNNAGFGTLGLFHQTELAGQDRMHRLHVLATMRLAHAALPGMVERKRGSMINVSSVSAFFHNPSSVSYCATKAWINSFTEGLHIELKSIGSPVRVQALCPGFTYSEFHDVLGVNRKRIPASFWMRAEDVVDESLRALHHNRLIVIPGWRYRWLVRMHGWLPRFLQHGGALRYGARFRQGAGRTGRI